LIGGLTGYGSDVPTNSIMWINATVSGDFMGKIVIRLLGKR
jgi:hypothetical protein